MPNVRFWPKAAIGIILKKQLYKQGGGRIV
jgi:hypothetical protein